MGNKIFIGTVLILLAIAIAIVYLRQPDTEQVVTDKAAIMRVNGFGLNIPNDTLRRSDALEVVKFYDQHAEYRLYKGNRLIGIYADSKCYHIQ